MLPQDVDDFLMHGADMILGKPLKISVLSAAVKEHFSDTIKPLERISEVSEFKSPSEASGIDRDRKCGNSDVILDGKSRRNSDVILDGKSRRNSDVSDGKYSSGESGMKLPSIKI